MQTQSIMNMIEMIEKQKAPEKALQIVENQIAPDGAQGIIEQQISRQNTSQNQQNLITNYMAPKFNQ